MNSCESDLQSPHESSWISVSLAFAMILAPVLGCAESVEEHGTSDDGTEVREAKAISGDPTSPKDMTFTESAGAMLDDTWQFITETTESGMVIVSEKCAAGTDMVVDASKAAWIWSSDKTVEGWDWIVENAGDATEWARDTASESWAIMKSKSGEFSLWVRVEAENGIAWARTTLPAAWEVTKNAAGDAIVWIDKHKVELAVAAAVVTVVVAGLIVAPEGVAPAVVKGAVAGTMAETTRFLTAVWNGRKNSGHEKQLQDVSQDMFMSIGKSVLSQCGSQVLGTVMAPAA